MDHFIRIAFWIVILSGCLQANSLPIHDSNIVFMRQHVECPSNSTFYAPKNVKDECMTTALDCVLKELDGTIKHECDDPEDDIDGAAEFLIRKINERKDKHPLTNSTECACERWSQTPLTEFLDAMESLLQLLNTEDKVTSVQ